jgi:REP-associated tyrosine transposase
VGAAGSGSPCIWRPDARPEETGDSSNLPRGWCLGSEQFRQELLLQMTTIQGSKFAGPEWTQTGQKKAELILAEEMHGRGWKAQSLQRLRMADPEKLKIAARLRAETTVTLEWIANHLSMGSPGYLSDCLRAARH